MVLKRFGSAVHSWSSFFVLSSWFLFYTSSRTLSNTTELSLLQLALCYYGWKKEESSRFYYIIGFISCLLRPTAVIIYIPLTLSGILGFGLEELRSFWRSLPWMFSLAGLSVLVDSVMYGRFTFSHWNFIEFNVLTNGASFFGTHHPLWYLTEGLPPILGPLYIILVADFIRAFRGVKSTKFQTSSAILRATLFFVCLAYSLQPHKEHRFLLPLVPLCALLAGIFCSNVFQPHRNKKRWSEKWIVGPTLAFNLILGVYFSLIHQRAPIDVVRHLATEAKNYSQMNVLFALPCHSTPLYSHIHYDIRTKFLSCIPNFEMEPEYRDEADRFCLDPVQSTKIYLQDKYSHIVVGSYLEGEVTELLESEGFVRSRQFFHQLIPDGRVGRYIFVYVRSN